MSAGWGIELILGREGDEGIFECSNAIETPTAVAEGLYQLFFERAFRLEQVDEALKVPLVGGMVLGGEDDGLASEAVAPSVQG